MTPEAKDRLAAAGLGILLVILALLALLALEIISC